MCLPFTLRKLIKEVLQQNNGVNLKRWESRNQDPTQKTGDGNTKDDSICKS